MFECGRDINTSQARTVIDVTKLPSSPTVGEVEEEEEVFR